MKFVSMSSSLYGPKKGTTAGFVMNLWTQNRLRTLPCRDSCLQALGGLEPHPLILCFHSALPALVHVAKIPLLTHDVRNSHDL